MKFNERSKIYMEQLREINNEAHELAIKQLELVRKAYLLRDDLNLNIESFPVEAEYRDKPVKMFRMSTPLLLPRLNVSLRLKAGAKAKSTKNDPYADSTYAHVNAIWNSIVGKAVKQAKVPKLMLEKAIIIYHHAVPLGRIQDYDSYDERCVNNALTQQGIFKDDECKILSSIRRMSYSDKARIEITVLEDKNILDDILKILVQSDPKMEVTLVAE